MKRATKKIRLPAEIQAGVKDMVGGLVVFIKHQTLLRELLEGENETKKTRALLKGKRGGDIQFALGYLFAVADWSGVEPSDLIERFWPAKVRRAA